MIAIYHLMRKIGPEKYICLMISEKWLDCHTHRDRILEYQKDISPPDLAIWGPNEYALHIRQGSILDLQKAIDRIHRFGEGLYGN